MQKFLRCFCQDCKKKFLYHGQLLNYYLRIGKKPIRCKTCGDKLTIKTLKEVSKLF